MTELSKTKVAVDSDAMKRAEEAVAILTLDEKVSLCHGASTMSIAALEKVGLKEEFVMSDSSHTVRTNLARDTFDEAGSTDDHSTNFPTLSALAATWNVELARRFGDALGKECRDRGKDMLLGPGINIMRTPLCGRNFEYMGEDPILAGRMASAHIKGVQSNDVAACIKHFAANNQELERNHVNVEMDERTLREIYLMGFEIAIKDGGALTVMNGYNKFRGEYCSHNDYLNNRVLKGEWGFPGLVVTDWGSIHDTVAGALGGTDVEMNAGENVRYFNEPLIEAVRAGTVPESVVDEKARRVLYVMARLGKLGGKTRAPGARNTPEHQELARTVAEQAIVLLKNDANVLPLTKDGMKKVLVLGRNATNKHCHLGWSAEGKPLYEVTPLEGLQNILGDGVDIDYAPLPDYDDAEPEQIPESCIRTIDQKAVDTGMTIRGWQAEYYSNTELEGTSLERFDRFVSFTWNQELFPEGVEAKGVSIRWRTTINAPEAGSYTLCARLTGGIRVWVDGKPVLDDWKNGRLRRVCVDTVLEANTAHDIVIEYFKPDQKRAAIQFGWQLPSDGIDDIEALVSKATSSDAVLIFTGNTHGHGRAKESEGGDRPNMLLPEGNDDALRALLGRNPNTVIINLSGAPVEMPWIEDAPTIVHNWFSGQEGGNALANVLFGNANPSGKLPFTFPRQLADSPAHALDQYNGTRVEHTEGVFVGYRWFDARGIEPLFPFGFGLSYTTFEYAKVKVTTGEPGEVARVTFTIKNTGSVEGDEVAQLYVRDVEATVERPVKELKGFARVSLKPGASQTVELPLTARDLSFWHPETKQWTAEKGAFEILIGASSRDIKLKTILQY